MDSPLLTKSKQFALDIIKVCNKVKSEKRESVLTNQLIRSGTSIGANVKEGAFAQSKADFTSKMFIAQKECAETEYWLELLYQSEYINKLEFDSIYIDCQELMRLIVASTKTLQSKKEKEKK